MNRISGKITRRPILPIGLEVLLVYNSVEAAIPYSFTINPILDALAETSPQD